MKVLKFGGSSVANAEQIKKVLQIFNSEAERKIMIVSAPGKRFPNDIKTTDLLLRLYEKVNMNLDYTHKKAQIIERYRDIVRDLDMKEDLLKAFEDTLDYYIEHLKDKPSRLLDALLSCGEDFNAQLLAQYNTLQGYPTQYISPKEAGIVVTDLPQNAQVLEESYEKILSLRNYSDKLIIPGFFGVSRQNYRVTFPRGGSDITGAIIARGVRADLYENFTDVSGIFRANPTVVKKPQVIKEITYREMRELSYAGFGVFHDEALQPLYKDRIPVVIKNTNRPQDRGTFILHNREIDTKTVVSGISCDHCFTVINIKKYLMNRQVGFVKKVLGILEDYNISFEHMPSGIDSISIILRSHQIKDVEEDVLNDIRRKCSVDDLNIEHDLAILMVVGEGMHRIVGTANKITSALAKANINLRMMNQGASEISIMFGIDVKDANKAVQVTYNNYFN
ncbi:aspartate kinase [Staphylococcus sp. SQ8-PEA]|uniref:Aspartokinase n=1 Tax=Staphylococcus marylandisciuri TaxID=2981529 RepID=A0ABT2QNQ8_9STAP|nr:aspartate kinase [Staphylococcus marylandisciuri]MCU5745601.1 aspartate kinase [Staphylococcus marylandisciuri]